MQRILHCMILIAGSLAIASTSNAESQHSGTIKVDGSSTVYPITEAVAEDFGKANPSVKVTVGISGTGGGFKKFCAGDTAISNASRPIKQSEIEMCQKAGIEYVEIPVAYDALSIIVNKNNTWASDITTAELKKLWEPEAQGKITNWNQIRASWPDKPIKLYGPGTDSGTYDYFTEAIMGKEDLSRGDYTSSEDDNVIVQGVSRDPNALGFLGLAYYEENQSKLKAIPVNDGIDTNGAGAVMPKTSTVLDGSYSPLARPLFIYAQSKELEKPEVKAFVDYFLKEGKSLSEEVGYVSLPGNLYELAQRRVDSRLAGSVFSGHGAKAGVSLAKLYEDAEKAK